MRLKKNGIFACCLILASCQMPTDTNENSSEVNTESEVIEQDNLENVVLVFDGLFGPDWINGVWTNSAESDLGKSETLSFQAGRVTIRFGNGNAQVEKKLCIDCVISELKKENFYMFTLTKPGYSLSYEFSLQDVDWTKDKVFSYSVTENGVVSRFHSTSVQHLFVKID